MFRHGKITFSALDIQLSGSIWHTASCRLRREIRTTQVHSVPLTHVASTAFYDEVLEYVKSRKSNCLRLKVVVEGIHGSEDERANDEAEYKLIYSTPALVSSIQDKAHRGILYNQSVLEKISQDYQIDYSKILSFNANIVPGSATQQHPVRLQDDYFKPLLVTIAGDCMVSGDDVVTQLDSQTTSTKELSKRREQRCCDTVANLISEGCEEIVLLWGHYHCPRILALLEKESDEFNSKQIHHTSYGIPSHLI